MTTTTIALTFRGEQGVFLPTLADRCPEAVSWAPGETKEIPADLAEALHAASTLFHPASVAAPAVTTEAPTLPAPASEGAGAPPQTQTEQPSPTGAEG
jgi:hypothetical protein